MKSRFPINFPNGSGKISAGATTSHLRHALLAAELEKFVVKTADTTQQNKEASEKLIPSTSKRG